jgi:hypothetical protein
MNKISNGFLVATLLLLWAIIIVARAHPERLVQLIGY